MKRTPKTLACCAAMLLGCPAVASAVGPAVGTATSTAMNTVAGTAASTAASPAGTTNYGTHLSFDGVGADTVQQIRGGTVSLRMRSGSGGTVSVLQVDPLVIDMGPGSVAKLVKPLGEFLENSPVRLGVEVWNTPDSRSRIVTGFENCLIASVRFPALDRNSENVNSVTLQLLPDLWTPRTGPMGGWAAPQWPQQLGSAMWRSGRSRNFSLALDGVDCPVSRVSSFVVGAEDVSAQRAKGPAPWSAVSPTSEHVFLTASGLTARRLRDWMAEAVAANGNPPRHQLTITYRNEFAVPLLRLTGQGVVPVALRATKQSQFDFEVELEVAVAQWVISDPSELPIVEKAVGSPMEKPGVPVGGKR